MLILSRTPRFLERVLGENRAKKSQVIITDNYNQVQVAIELRHILYKYTGGQYVAHSTVWRVYDGYSEPTDTVVTKGKSFPLLDGDDVVVVVRDIDSVDNVEIGFHAPDWVSIERMDMGERL